MIASANMNAETIRQTAQEVLSNARYQTSQNESVDLILLLERFFRWVFSPLAELFGPLSGISLVFAWVIFGLVVVGFLMLMILVCNRLITFKRTAYVARNLRHESRHRDPLELEKLANDSFESRDYVVAVRLYLMATLLRLELAQEKRFRPGMTNQEHLRRYQRSPLFEPMQYIVNLMDRTWYGGVSCDLESASKCRDAYHEIRAHIQRLAHVNRT